MKCGRCISAATIFVVALAAGCVRSPSQPATRSSPTAVLMIAEDLRGYLAPCGCSEAMRGGIARAAFQVDGARKDEPTLFLAGGSCLFGHSSLTEAQIPQEERKAQALADSLKAMRLAARAPGPLDLVRGEAFEHALGLPDLSPGEFRALNVGGHSIGVVAAGSADQLSAAAGQARSGGAEFVVAFLSQSLEAAQRSADQTGLGADLIVATGDQGEFSAEDNRMIRTAVPVARAQSKGRSLIRVDLAFGHGARFELMKTQLDAERETTMLDERIQLLKKQINVPGLREDSKALYQQKLGELVERRHALAVTPPPLMVDKNVFAVRFIPLESTLPDLPAVKEVVDAYDREVSTLNVAWARAHGRDCPAPKKNEAAFIGNEGCRVCHAEAFAVWEQSKHAHAYATLEKVGKQYNLDCVACHVTGANQPGGVCRVDKVDGRKNVGCENCHGPGSLHEADPIAANIRARPAESACVGCHNPENSPHFDFATFLPRILGSGHQAKTQPLGPARVSP